MRKILPIITALAVAFSLCVPAFAVGTDGDFLTLSDSTDASASTLVYSTYAYNGTSYITGHFYSGVGSVPVYAGYVFTGSYYIYVFWSSDVFDLYDYFSSPVPVSSWPDITPPASLTRYGTANLDSTTGLYYFSISISTTTNNTAPRWDLTEFASVADLLAYASGWTPPAPEPVASPRITIPAGYVMYFKASSDVSASLSITYNASNISTFGRITQSDFTQRYGTQPSLPTGTVNWALGSALTWSLSGGFFGFTSSFTSQLDFAQSVGYYYLYNPSLSMHWTDAGTYVPNPSMLVTFSGSITDIHLYPLAVAGVAYDDDGNVTGISSNGNGTVYDGTIDSTTGNVTFEDADGNELIPPSGGLDGPAYYSSPEGLADSYSGLFTSFSDSLSSIFGGVVDAFQHLISGASSFISSLGQLFSWLPSEIVTFLTSSLIVIVIAGVIKAVLP